MTRRKNEAIACNAFAGCGSGWRTPMTELAHNQRLDAQPQVTVRWTNRDALVHSVASDDGRFGGSGPISQGADFTATFLTPGEYPFHCRYHPDMKGIIVVA